MNEFKGSAHSYLHEYDMWDECEHVSDKDRTIWGIVATLFVLGILD